MPIGFVYFDIDDTLLDHRAAQRSALADTITHFREHFQDLDAERIQEVYDTHNSRLWKQYAAGDVSRDQLRKGRFEQLLATLAITSVTPESVGDTYMSRYAHYWDYCTGALETFSHMAERFPVGVLTNGFADQQYAKLARFPAIKDRLAVTVISEEVGYLKPHPELFKHAAREAQTAPQDILYIGDSFTSDVEGGMNAGWQVIWYAPNASSVPENVSHVRALTDIPGIL